MNILWPPRGQRWKILVRVPLALAVVMAMGAILVLRWTWMPGRSHSATLPPAEREHRRVAGELERHVQKLAGDIGQRNAWTSGSLQAASDVITRALEIYGYDDVERHRFEAHGHEFDNISAELTGAQAPEEVVVVGAHYDTALGSPGADDHASGVAAALVLAQRLRSSRLGRTVRFVFFANEEPPFFQNEGMGSLSYAEMCRRRGDDIVAMISLESVGYYADSPSSQKYPPPFDLLYPSTGNFVGFVGDRSSAGLVRRTVEVFRRHATLPSEALAAPAWVNGVDFSDHWSFSQAGYPALMATDTAPFRNPNYHLESDAPDTLDYERLARFVLGMEAVILDLGGQNGGGSSDARDAAASL